MQRGFKMKNRKIIYCAKGDRSPENVLIEYNFDFFVGRIIKFL
jgi:hypothetical protein